MRRTWISTAAAAALTTGGAVGAWAQEKQPRQDQAPAMQMQNGQDQPTSATPWTKAQSAHNDARRKLSDDPSMGESQKPNGKVGP